MLDDLGREPEAEEAFAEAVRLDPGSAFGWHGYGVILQKRGRTAQAARAYERAISIEPNKVESLVNLSMLLSQSGELDRAGKYLETAFLLRPDDPVVSGAFESFAEAVHVKDGSARGWHAYGVILEKHKRTAQAVRAYERALAIEPHKVETLVNLSMFLRQSGEPDRALAYLTTAFTARPGDPTVYQAFKSFALGDPDRVAAFLVTTLAVRPGDPLVLGPIGYFERITGRKIVR